MRPQICANPLGLRRLDRTRKAFFLGPIQSSQSFVQEARSGRRLGIGVLLRLEMDGVKGQWLKSLKIRLYPDLPMSEKLENQGQTEVLGFFIVHEI